jgi:hypothetical protein
MDARASSFVGSVRWRTLAARHLVINVHAQFNHCSCLIDFLEINLALTVRDAREVMYADAPTDARLASNVHALNRP